MTRFAKGCSLEKKGSHQRTHLSIARAKGLVKAGSVSSFSLEMHTPPVYDQTEFGCCEGASGSSAVYTRFKAKGTPLPWLPSVGGIYMPALALDRAAATPPNQALPQLQDLGTETNTVERVLSIFGIRASDSYPSGTYVDITPSSILLDPNLEQLEQGAKKLIIGPYSINDTGNQKIQDIKDCITSLIPVRVDSWVDMAFERWTPNQKPIGVPDYNDSRGGGHALYIIGFIGDNFVVRNSWGVSWGASGNIVVSPEWVLQTDTFAWDVQEAA